MAELSGRNPVVADDTCVLRRKSPYPMGGVETVICGPERAQQYILQGYVTDSEWNLQKGRRKRRSKLQFFKDLVGRSTANSDVFVAGAAIAFLLTWVF